MKHVFIFLIFTFAYSCSNPKTPEVKAEPIDTLKTEVIVDSSSFYSLQPSHIDLPFQSSSLYDVVTKEKQFEI